MIELEGYSKTPPDLGLELAKEATRIISEHSIALVVDGKLVGSGTCVLLNGRRCLLTAAHVVNEIRTRQQPGIPALQFIIDAMPHKSGIELQHLGLYTCPGYSRPGTPPDLGLIVLPESHNVTMQMVAMKSFTPISAASAPTIPEKDGMLNWMLFGHPGDSVRLDFTNERFGDVQATTAWCYPSTIVEKHPKGTQDFWEIRPWFPHVENPNYQGVSGGGLWGIEFSRTPEDKIVMSQLNLFGVAYYQSELDKNGARDIHVMGPESIYSGCPEWAPKP